MLFSTFYFSGTGNTEWSVRQFSGIVVQSGHRAELYSLDNFERYSGEELIKIVNESTGIGFANPIYGTDIPPIMKAFIHWLTELCIKEGIRAKPFYIINTFGYVNAFGPFAARKIFNKDCFELVAYVNIRLCNNISTYTHKSAFIGSEKLSIRKEKALEELTRLANRLLSSKKYIKGIGPYLLPGIFIRKKVGKSIQGHYQKISVQEKTCNRCMICVKNCPANSIKFKEQRFEFSAECTSCMRCYNFCPTASIMIDGIYTDPQEYFRYKGPER